MEVNKIVSIDTFYYNHFFYSYTLTNSDICDMFIWDDVFKIVNPSFNCFKTNKSFKNLCILDCRMYTGYTLRQKCNLLPRSLGQKSGYIICI